MVKIGVIPRPIKIDRILISSDNNPLYIQFLPVVSLAWQKLIGIKPTLAYVSYDNENIDWAKEYCQDIVVYKFGPEIKRGSTATFCARLVVRTLFGNEICMVSDIDMIPLSKNIFVNLPSDFTRNKFLSIGYNVFKNGDGSPNDPAVRNSKLRKVPSCYTIASSKVWKEIINPNNVSEKEILKQYYNIRDYDSQEAIINSGYFCDESLMRALLQRWNRDRSKVIGIDRNFSFDRLDRGNWNINTEKLYRGEYIDAHCPRPMSSYEESIKSLTKYLDIPYIIPKL